MNNYELTVILRTANSESLKEKVKEILTKFEVTISEEAPWGTKRLAYEIDDEKEGYYFFALIEALPENVDKIIAEFRLIPDILRYMFVKTRPATA